MKNTTPRRSFLSNSLKATLGLTLVSSVVPTKMFASKVEKADFRTKTFSKYVEVTGQIFDKNGKLPISEAQIEISYLSSNNNNGQTVASLTTNTQGEYQFITDWPNRELGKQPRIYFKVSKNNNVVFTELIFNDLDAHITAKHWEQNQQLAENIRFPTFNTFLNKSTINFNFTIN
jgi:protocatechuate 3,4-dioxygenase beta subunit